VGVRERERERERRERETERGRERDRGRERERTATKKTHTPPTSEVPAIYVGNIIRVRRALILAGAKVVVHCRLHRAAWVKSILFTQNEVAQFAPILVVL
jgi:hypothetical protein